MAVAAGVEHEKAGVGAGEAERQAERLVVGPRPQVFIALDYLVPR